MNAMFDSEEVRKMLERAAINAGSQSAFAKELGVSDAFLSALIRGRRAPAGKALQWLGLKRVVFYERADHATPTER